MRAGLVRVGRGGERATKPSQLVPADVELTLDEGQQFVSRGGIKLGGALDALDVSVRGLRCVDVGASTGGFTDCLLQRGAEQVIALDVGHGQLDWRLRNDERVIVIEGRNARDLTPDELPWRPELATVDVSFISITKILPGLVECLAPRARVLALVKPQFELGPDRVGRGGIVRLAEDRRDGVRMVAGAAVDLGMFVSGVSVSVKRGAKGNQETFLLLDRVGPGCADYEAEIVQAGC